MRNVASVRENALMPEPSSPAFTIRPVRESEHASLGEITVRAYLEGGFLHGPDDYYAAHLRDVAARAATAEVLVAADAERLLGGVTLVLAGGPMANMAGPGEAEIRMLAVDPLGHRKGIGSALVAHCVERARAEAGVKRIVLCSQQEMTTAHRIYERFGFERAPQLDWRPMPDVLLWGFSLEL